jgi:hypothetical protein
MRLYCSFLIEVNEGGLLDFIAEYDREGSSRGEAITE